MDSYKFIPCPFGHFSACYFNRSSYKVPWMKSTCHFTMFLHQSKHMIFKIQRLHITFTLMPAVVWPVPKAFRLSLLPPAKRKVLFSQACVILSTRGVCPSMDLGKGVWTGRWGEVDGYVDRESVHPTPRRWRPLQRAVRILLEYILIYLFFPIKGSYPYFLWSQRGTRVRRNSTGTRRNP